MAKSPAEALASMFANMKANTGRSLDEWLKIAAKSGAAKHGEIVKYLKSEHGLSHGFANQIALKALEAAAGGPASADELVAAQYAGAKAALRPIYDALLAAARKFGRDVEISPKKSCVSLRRSKQFALIQAAAATRVDVGLQLKGVAIGGRLEPWPNPMCTLRVRLTKKEHVDAELVGWLRQAYDAA